jgi:hypothetical protein
MHMTARSSASARLLSFPISSFPPGILGRAGQLAAAGYTSFGHIR